MSARLLRLGALAVLLPGCGLLAPSLYGPSVVAPNVVPDADGSTVVVTMQQTSRSGVEGRVIDRDSGAGIASVQVVARSAGQDEVTATTDARGAFRFDGLAGDTSFRAQKECYAPLDAQHDVAAPASLLVMMAPADCGP